MAYYQRPITPEERFRDFLKFQDKLRLIAIEEGYTLEEAEKLLVLWQLSGIRDEISNRY